MNGDAAAVRQLLDEELSDVQVPYSSGSAPARDSTSCAGVGAHLHLDALPGHVLPTAREEDALMAPRRMAP